MGYSSNQFPVFLTIKTDGSVQTEIRAFEQFAVGAMGRVAGSVARAGQAADGSFNFASAKRELNELSAGIDRLKTRSITSSADFLGISSSLASLRNNPLLGGLKGQLDAEQKLSTQRLSAVDAINRAEASLEAQRERAIQDRIAGIEREFNAAIRAIEGQQAARAAAGRAAVAEVDRQISLERQREREQAQGRQQFASAVGPAFTGIAETARELERLRVVELNAAKAADYLQAINTTTGASFVGLGNSARESAAVFQQAFAEQERAAIERTNGIVRAIQAVSEAARAAHEEQRRLVTGREFIQAPGFDPASATQSAAAARTHATALDQLARAAENVALQEGKATATDRAYAAQMREAATAAGIEAGRLEELAATQLRVQGAAKGLNAANLELGSSQRQSRFAALQASQQFQDFFIQIGSGQSALVAFSQQASQLAFVMSASGGEAGKFARIMSGGAGTVAFALLALIPLGLQWSGILDDGQKKTKKLTEAKELHKKTIDQLIEAINQENEALGKNNQTSSESERQALANAKAKQSEALARLFNVKALIEESKAANKRFEGSLASADPRFASQFKVNEGAIAELEASVGKLEAAVRAATLGAARASQPIARREDEARRDPRARVTVDYEAALDRASKQYDLQVNSGVRVKDAQDTYVKAITAAGDARDKENKAIDAREEAERKRQALLDRAANDAQRRSELTQFKLPVEGRITGRFGERRPDHLHGGIDLAVPVGTPTKAAAAGTVIQVGTIPGYGNVVVIDHGGGTLTRYAHLSQFNTTKGASVAQGDVIGLSGGAKGAPGAGNSQGPHVHFEVREGGKPVNPLLGGFRTDQFAASQASEKATQAAAAAAERAARAAQNEQERLTRGAEAAAERVARITAQFDKQPRLIDQAAAAQRELNRTIAESGKLSADYDALIGKLSKEKPEGWEQTVALLQQGKTSLAEIVANAEKAGPVVAEGLLRPLTEYVEKSAEQAQVDALRLAGREDEAEAMQKILTLEDQMGPLSEARKRAVLETVRAEKAMQDALEENERLIGRAVNSARTFQDALNGVVMKPFDISSWKEGISSIFTDFRKNWAESITSGFLGGDLGKQFEDMLRQKSDPLGASADELTTSALELHKSAIALANAGASLTGAGSPSAGQVAATPSAYLPTGAGGALGAIGSTVGGPVGNVFSIFGQMANGLGTVGQEAQQQTNVGLDTQDLIRRQTQIQQRSALLSNPVEYYNLLGKTVGGSIDKSLGTGGLFGSIGGKLGTVMQGVQMGQMAGSLLSALGLKGKGTSIGSSIGGGIGALVGGPVGSIIGGLLGGLVGSLFGKKKVKKGEATIGGDEFGNLGVGSSSGQTTRQQGSIRAANNVINTLEGMAEQFRVLLDASLGKVSVGIRDDDYRVDPTGGGRTKGGGVLNFGSDSQGAIEAAVLDLINDGVLVGLRDGTKALLKNARDLQNGLTKALKFEDVFKRLKSFKDPLGAAIDDLDFEFNNLRKIFAEAGASAAEYAQLEELYAYERAEAIKKAAKDATSTLKALLDDLTFKGDYGLSLRTREKNAFAAFSPFQQQINEGKPVDQEAFADAARALLEVERAIYGSTSQYFDMLATITALTQRAMGIVTQPTSGIPGVPAITNTPTAVSTVPNTSATPGYSTQAPGGGAYPFGSPTNDATTAAANDNYAMAQIIALELRKEQELMRQFLTPMVLVNVIQTALRGMPELFAGDSKGQATSQPDNNTTTRSPFVPASEDTGTTNLAIQGTLDQLLSAAQATEENTRTMVRTSATPGANSFGAGDSNDNSYAYTSVFPTIPRDRLQTSVSRFA